MRQKVLNVLVLLSVLSGLIFVHELGHFLVAKAFHAHVQEFSIGFGSEIVGFTHADTRFALSAVPFGGYVKLAQPDSLMQQCLIALAGPGMSMLACGLLAFFVKRTVEGEEIPLKARAAFALLLTFFAPVGIYLFLRGWFTSPKKSLKETQGPIGLLTEQPNLKYPFLLRAAALSLGIAIFNLLPFNPLDGGRVASALIGRIAGDSMKSLFDTIGVWIFIAFAAVIFLKDLVVLIRKGISLFRKTTPQPDQQV